MKKVMSLLIALAMLFIWMPAVFAATDGQLVDGDNDLELPWDTDDASVYTYTATQTGTLYIVATEFYYALKDYDYYDNSSLMNEWTMYTSLTIDGAELSGGYFGSIEVVEGQTYTFSWEHLYATEQWYDYGWSAVLNLSYTNEWMPQVGTEELPAVLHIEQCPTNSIEIGAGEIVHYTLYDFDGAHLVVTGENAYITATVFNLETALQEDVYYEAVDGVVTMPINSSYMKIQIGNAGDTAATFLLDYYYTVGTLHKPAELVLGENVAVTQADNYDGYCFTWTAPCSGVLVLTFPETGWMYNIRNITAGTRGETCYYTDPDVFNPVYIQVSGGDLLQIVVNSYNGVNMTVPGGEVKMIASGEFDHHYDEVQIIPGNCTSAGKIIHLCTNCDDSYTEEGEIDPSNHVSIVQTQIGKDATCTEDGSKPTWACEGCGTLFADEQGTVVVTYEDQILPATGHSFGQWVRADDGKAEIRTCETCGFQESREWVCPHSEIALIGAVEANCTEEGYTGDMVCQECGAVITAGTVIPAAGHSFGPWEPTENVRIEIRTCTVCGFQQSRDLDCVHTDTALTGAKDATCTEDGYTGDVVCSECYEVLTQGQSIPAVGHNHVITQTTAGTCTAKSTTTYTCTACGDSYLEEGALDAVNHVTLQQTAPGKQATCTEDGVKATWTCADCQGVFADALATVPTTYEDQVIPATGHNLGKWYVAKAQTCTQKGQERRDCANCQHCETREIAAEGHSYTAAVTAPTCTEKGYTTHTCAACGHSYRDQEEAALDHTEVVDAAVEPTCTQSGLSEGKHCSTCQTVLVEQTVVPAKGHADGDGNYICDVCESDLCVEHVEEILPGVKPTCQNEGLTEGKKCGICGEILQTQEPIPALDHDWLDATCENAKTCKTCGKLEGEALSHSYGAWSEVKAPTTEETGLAERACSACGKTEQKVLEKLEPTVTQPTEPAPTDPKPTDREPTEPTASTPGNTTGTQPNGQTEPAGNHGVLAVVIVAAVVIGAAAAIWFLLKKRK